MSRTLLVISQVYPPDPTSVGQHMADAAAELARRGLRVRVLTANRGYNDPSVRYPSRETRDGVDVVRLPLSSFGKGSIASRVLGGLSFVLQCIVRGWGTGGLAGILVSTSPPMAAFAAVAIAFVRRVPIKFWAMDLNPDQAVALGQIPPRALSVRLLEALNRVVLRRATDVVALDRFMAERLNDKVPVESKTTVLPPWPHEDVLEALPHEDNPFRAKHGLDGKFVLMYSGNISVASPLTTLLDAALQLRHRDDLVFLFIGGGGGRKEIEQTVERHRPDNIRLLPYQPLSELRYSLSAADVHIVSVGDRIVGICHPCKVYGAMAVARPVLLLGPEACHVADIMEGQDIGWHIRHGDVDGAVRTIEGMLEVPHERLEEMGRRAQGLVARKYGKQALCGAFCDVVEKGLDAA